LIGFEKVISRMGVLEISLMRGVFRDSIPSILKDVMDKVLSCGLFSSSVQENNRVMFKNRMKIFLVMKLDLKI
jgi:hypothetical protein